MPLALLQDPAPLPVDNYALLPYIIIGIVVFLVFMIVMSYFEAREERRAIDNVQRIRAKKVQRTYRDILDDEDFHQS